jgi:hypothetical protein
MPAQTHSSRANQPVARLHPQQRVDGQRGVLVVRGHFLGDFELVALVCAGYVVGERVGGQEFVVGGWRGADVAVRGDLAAEAGDGAGYCWWEGEVSGLVVEIEMGRSWLFLCIHW